MSDPDLPGSYAKAWDEYAARAGAGRPGDEWGDPTLWQRWFEDLFVPAGVARWERAVEIGPGAGKYTAKVLDASPGEVLALDVSPRFLELCRERFRAELDQGRLHLARIDETDPDALSHAVAARGWQGHVDAVFSIDTFVHLTFAHVCAHLRAAAEALRPGGHFLFTFADATSDAGFRKLLADLDETVRRRCDPRSGCFHWLSPDLVRSAAERMGYRVLLCRLDPAHQRDGQFLGTLQEPARAAALRPPRRA